MTRVAVALGSNLGDRESHLAFALARLSGLLADLRCSSWCETAPAVPGGQPRYLNGAVTGMTALAPRALLEALLGIERARVRERPFPEAPRTLDLDLIFFGDQVIHEPGLEVPHPRFRLRGFVLDPLAEIAADWRDPVTGTTVGDLRARRRAGRDL